MTQPNPGDGTNAAPSTQNPPQGPANGQAATQPTTTAPPTPPGFVPATGSDTTAEGQPTATQEDPNGKPGDDLGDAGKRALAAERERAKKAEAATKEQAKQLETLQEQLKALQPAAELFAQFRKAAVPEEEKTDTERLQEQIAKLQEETQSERVQRWRLEIATEKGLTPQQAVRLQGKTRDELAADADALLALFPQASPPPPPASPPTTESAPGQQPAAQPQPTTNGPRPDPSQGARGPVDINAQIQDALAKGDIKTSIALKQHLAAQQRGGTQ